MILLSYLVAFTCLLCCATCVYVIIIKEKNSESSLNPSIKSLPCVETPHETRFGQPLQGKFPAQDTNSPRNIDKKPTSPTNSQSGSYGVENEDHRAISDSGSVEETDEQEKKMSIQVGSKPTHRNRVRSRGLSEVDTVDSNYSEATQGTELSPATEQLLSLEKAAGTQSARWDELHAIMLEQTLTAAQVVKTKEKLRRAQSNHSTSQFAHLSAVLQEQAFAAQLAVLQQKHAHHSRHVESPPRHQLALETVAANPQGNEREGGGESSRWNFNKLFPRENAVRDSLVSSAESQLPAPPPSGEKGRRHGDVHSSSSYEGATKLVKSLLRQVREKVLATGKFMSECEKEVNQVAAELEDFELQALQKRTEKLHQILASTASAAPPASVTSPKAGVSSGIDKDSKSTSLLGFGSATFTTQQDAQGTSPATGAVNRYDSSKPPSGHSATASSGTFKQGLAVRNFAIQNADQQRSRSISENVHHSHPESTEQRKRQGSVPSMDGIRTLGRNISGPASVQISPKAPQAGNSHNSQQIGALMQTVKGRWQHQPNLSGVAPHMRGQERTFLKNAATDAHLLTPGSRFMCDVRNNRIVFRFKPVKKTLENQVDSSDDSSDTDDDNTAASAQDRQHAGNNGKRKKVTTSSLNPTENALVMCTVQLDTSGMYEESLTRYWKIPNESTIVEDVAFVLGFAKEEYRWQNIFTRIPASSKKDVALPEMRFSHK